MSSWYEDNENNENRASDETSFKKFMYENICQCLEQCIEIKPSNFVVKKQQICSQIINIPEIKDKSYDNLINNVLDYFVNNNILIKIGIKYYIINDDDKLKLTWENIKTIKYSNIKELLWLFRKVIIDTILRKILLKIHDPDFKIYSVGSSNITSDYDITLYGDTHDKSYVIKKFKQEFNNYFHEDSSLVFDTNIYGEAYITFKPEQEQLQFYTKINCNNIEFYYLNQSNNDSQLMWGLVKYLSDIRDSFGEYIYNDLVHFMENKISSLHIYNAKKTLIYLRNKDKDSIKYEILFNIKNNFIKSYDDELVGISDYTSLINYYGTETYYTRGAFLDIVVNNQMCKKDIIQLNDSDYIVSILENAGFFFIHNNKTKYIIRVYNTLIKLINSYTEFDTIKTSQSFKILDSIIKNLGKNPDENYCKWVLEDSDDEPFNLLKCEKYSIFNHLFNIIYKLLSIYTSLHHSNESNFIFYNNYVTKNTSELGSPNIPSPSRIRHQPRFSLTGLVNSRRLS